jgi:hypothetical protein
MDNDS